MLGLRLPRPICTRFQWWFGCLLGVFGCLIGVVTLGYVATDWDIRWLVYLADKRHEKSDCD